MRELILLWSCSGMIPLVCGLNLLYLVAKIHSFVVERCKSKEKKGCC